MTANSTLPAAGDVIAADDIGGVKHQQVKIEFGATGVATQVSSSNPLPVAIASSVSDPFRGTSAYFGGTSGTVVVPSGARIVSISAHATTAGAVTIFGGPSVPIPAGNAFSDEWSGFSGPGSIVFAGTDSYYVVVNQ